jgi:hypothetical protein
MRASYYVGVDNASKVRGLNMTSYLKVVLSAAGAVALIASPVLAKTAHHRTTHAYGQSVPAYGQPVAESPVQRQFVTPYGANLRQPAESSSVNPDFQVPGKY